VAITLLLAGGLDTLQQAAIVAGAPFAIVMIGIAVSLVKALREEEVAVVERPATVTIPEPSPSPAGGSR
jgi:choline-glycine betaine transporter